MSVSEVIATLNRMTADGVIERYAIGGATTRFESILVNHGLIDRWHEFKGQFLRESS